MQEITNTENFINTSDLMKRITELAAKAERDEYEDEELTALRKLRNQLESMLGNGYAERNNKVIVRETYFEEYAREEAYDMGGGAWEGSVDSHVDWEGYANAVRQDWSDVDFDGTTYLVRL
jgi:hypothetical protein